MTVRNIRAHQSRDLLPPPEVRGRTGYGPDHARIELIQELQADGFNLKLIKRLIEEPGAAGEGCWSSPVRSADPSPTRSRAGSSGQR